MNETTLDTSDALALALDCPLTLTILVHPDVRRLGQQCVLNGRGPHQLSRNEANFADPGDTPAPLGDRHVSRRPIRIIAYPSGAAVSSESSKSRLDGKPLNLVPTRVDAATLERGIVLTLSGRVAVMLRRAKPAPARGELGMIGPSPELARARQRIRLLAPGDHPILINAPTGCGKELIARALHDQSARAGRPWVAVNLAAIPPSTAASQLFGHVRGAFTGARTGSSGLFGEAAGGTLFLDELGEAPGDVQPLLLRALESGEVQVVGGGVRVVDVRIIAATDADLDEAVRSGRLRPALYHRLAGSTITLAPLRERREDIAAQLRHFIVRKLHAIGREDRITEPGWLTSETQFAFVFHDWPGNTRQLLQNVEGMVIECVADERARTPANLEAPAPAGGATPTAPPPAPPSPGPEGDADALARVLATHDYRLMPSAKALGVSINTLKQMMKRHGFPRAKELSRDEIEAARARVGPDVPALARALRVSAHGLRLRLRELE